MVIYTALQTLTPKHLFTFASAVAENPINSSQVQPASNLTIELYNDATVQGYYLDEPILLAGCKVDSPCLTADFISAIAEKITIGDVNAFCSVV